jgi:hypothetical protein
MPSLRDTPPATPDGLWDHIWLHHGIRVGRTAVCAGHVAPFDALCCWHFDRPGQALLLGPRGGGKSFLAGLDVHMDSRWNPRHSTRILAGSRAQAQQIYNVLHEAVRNAESPIGEPDGDTIQKLLREHALYHNGSDVRILAATPKSVRGPHVPSLKLDEVDEIPDETREDAMGALMEKRGQKQKLVLTSTWHRKGGPMEGLIAQARAADAERPGSFPFHAFCIWEALEHCPSSRSGPRTDRQADGSRYADCPACPLREFCYADDDGEESYRPKAKRARGGHYTVDSLVGKTYTVSRRVFEADYLCTGPRADGLWFTDFDPAVHVKPVEYDPKLPLSILVDCGVSYHTGAVFAQPSVDPRTGRPSLNVLGDYYAEGLHSEQNARAIMDALRDDLEIDPIRVARLILDPASGMNSGLGPSARSEYERVWGAGRVDCPPQRGVMDGLDFLEKLVMLADRTTTLAIHPRAEHTIRAFQGYRQAKRNGQWTGRPADPQHPAEDMLDSIRYGLWYVWPDGWPLALNADRVHAAAVT